MNQYYVLKFGGTSQLSSTYEMIKQRIIQDRQNNPNFSGLNK
jgi:aspartokinase